MKYLDLSKPGFSFYRSFHISNKRLPLPIVDLVVSKIVLDAQVKETQYGLTGALIVTGRELRGLSLNREELFACLISFNPALPC